MQNQLIPLLEQGSVWGIILALGIGIVTSFNPCSLSMFPLIIGYIGGFEQGHRLKGFLLSCCFVLGLATTFSFLGLTAAYLGKVFGQGLGNFWPYLTGGISLLMGLYLLGWINFNFPGIKKLPFVIKGWFGAFLLGLTFGFVASPCATPILAVVLSFIAQTGNPTYSSLVLFSYGVGQGFPIILLGTFTSFLKSLDKFKFGGEKIKIISGFVLIIFGLYLIFIR